jgi:hypothetical protein
LEQESFVLATERAENRLSFSVADGSGVDYLPDGLIELRLAHGRKKKMPEADYLRFLQDARTTSAAACRTYETAMAQWLSEQAR